MSDRELSSYAFSEYGGDAKLYNGIHDLEQRLKAADDAVAEERTISQANTGFAVQRVAELERKLKAAEDALAGVRENSSSIAVRLGVDPENMGDAETWNASAKAIQKADQRLAQAREVAVELLKLAGDYVCDIPECQKDDCMKDRALIAKATALLGPEKPECKNSECPHGCPPSHYLEDGPEKPPEVQP